MRAFYNFLLLCFFLLLGTTFTQASACKHSSGHSKIKLYITESSKHGKYGSVDDVLTTENEFALNIENEEDEHESKKYESFVRNSLSNFRFLLLIRFENCNTSFCCIDNPPFFHNSIYIAQRVLRI